MIKKKIKLIFFLEIRACIALCRNSKCIETSQRDLSDHTAIGVTSIVVVAKIEFVQITIKYMNFRTEAT